MAFSVSAQLRVQTGIPGLGAAERELRSALTRAVSGLTVTIDAAAVAAAAAKVRQSLSGVNSQPLAAAAAQAERLADAMERAARASSSFTPPSPPGGSGGGGGGGGGTPPGGAAPGGGGGGGRPNVSIPAPASSAPQEYERVAQAIGKVGQEARDAGTFLSGFAASSGLALRRFGAFVVGAGALTRAFAGLREGVSQAIEFERTLVRVGQVSGDTRADVSQLGRVVSQLSSGLGVSSSELSKAALTLRQAGLAGSELRTILSSLAETSLAPNFDGVAQTAEGVVAISQQFGVSAGQMREALGSLNAVAGDFAVEGRDLIEAVKRAGGAFASTSGQIRQPTESLRQFAALFTSVRATTRESAESIATGLRTVFSRLQRPESAEALKGIGVELRRTREEARQLGDLGLEGQFVGAYEAVEKISEAVAGLRGTDPRFGAAVETLGGFRQVSRVVPLLTQFGEARKALLVAQSGQDSLTGSTERSQESLANRLDRTKEGYLELFRAVSEDRGLQALTQNLLAVADALRSGLEYLRPYLSILTTIAAVKIGQNVLNIGASFLAGAAGRPSAAPRRALGGKVPGRSDVQDAVPVMATGGEYVMREPAVRSLGIANVEHMNRTGRLPLARGALVTPQRLFRSNLEAAQEAFDKTGLGGAYKLDSLSTGIAVTGGALPHKPARNDQKYLGEIDPNTRLVTASTLAGPDKLASVLLHELTHGADLRLARPGSLLATERKGPLRDVANAAYDDFLEARFATQPVQMRSYVAQPHESLAFGMEAYASLRAPATFNDSLPGLARATPSPSFAAVAEQLALPELAKASAMGPLQGGPEDAARLVRELQYVKGIEHKRLVYRRGRLETEPARLALAAGGTVSTRPGAVGVVADRVEGSYDGAVYPIPTRLVGPFNALVRNVPGPTEDPSVLRQGRLAGLARQVLPSLKGRKAQQEFFERVSPFADPGDIVAAKNPPLLQAGEDDTPSYTSVKLAGLQVGRLSVAGSRGKSRAFIDQAVTRAVEEALPEVRAAGARAGGERGRFQTVAGPLARAVATVAQKLFPGEPFRMSERAVASRLGQAAGGQLARLFDENVGRYASTEDRLRAPEAGVEELAGRINKLPYLRGVIYEQAIAAVRGPGREVPQLTTEAFDFDDFRAEQFPKPLREAFAAPNRLQVVDAKMTAGPKAVEGLVKKLVNHVISFPNDLFRLFDLGPTISRKRAEALKPGRRRRDSRVQPVEPFADVLDGTFKPTDRDLPPSYLLDRANYELFGGDRLVSRETGRDLNVGQASGLYMRQLREGNYSPSEFLNSKLTRARRDNLAAVAASGKPLRLPDPRPVESRRSPGLVGRLENNILALKSRGVDLSERYQRVLERAPADSLSTRKDALDLANELREARVATRETDAALFFERSPGGLANPEGGLERMRSQYARALARFRERAGAVSLRASGLGLELPAERPDAFARAQEKLTESELSDFESELAKGTPPPERLAAIYSTYRKRLAALPTQLTRIKSAYLGEGRTRLAAGGVPRLRPGTRATRQSLLRDIEQSTSYSPYRDLTLEQANAALTSESVSRLPADARFLGAGAVGLAFRSGDEVYRLQSARASQIGRDYIRRTEGRDISPELLSDARPEAAGVLQPTGSERVGSGKRRVLVEKLPYAEPADALPPAELRSQLSGLERKLAGQGYRLDDVRVGNGIKTSNLGVVGGELVVVDPGAAHRVPAELLGATTPAQPPAQPEPPALTRRLTRLSRATGGRVDGPVVTREKVLSLVRELQNQTGIKFSSFVKKVRLEDNTEPGKVGQLPRLGNYAVDGKTGDGTLTLNLATIKSEDQLRDVLYHELGHGVDVFLGRQKTGRSVASSRLGGEEGRYASQEAALQKKIDLSEGVRFDKNRQKYFYSQEESFANLFRSYALNDDTDESKRARRGFGRRVVEQAAIASNPNYKPVNLGLFGNIARKDNIFGRAARYFGFNSGGMVPVLLTPGEVVFTPQEVNRIGLPKLERINKTGKVGYADGGVVPGTGDADSVPMELPAGSFVVRKPVAKHNYPALMQLKGYAKGGRVGYAEGGGVEVTTSLGALQRRGASQAAAEAERQARQMGLAAGQINASLRVLVQVLKDASVQVKTVSPQPEQTNKEVKEEVLSRARGASRASLASRPGAFAGSLSLESIQDLPVTEKSIKGTVRTQEAAARAVEAGGETASVVRKARLDSPLLLSNPKLAKEAEARAAAEGRKVGPETEVLVVTRGLGEKKSLERLVGFGSRRVDEARSGNLGGELPKQPLSPQAQARLQSPEFLEVLKRASEQGGLTPDVVNTAAVNAAQDFDPDNEKKLTFPQFFNSRLATARRAAESKLFRRKDSGSVDLTVGEDKQAARGQFFGGRGRPAADDSPQALAAREEEFFDQQRGVRELAAEVVPSKFSDANKEVKKLQVAKPTGKLRAAAGRPATVPAVARAEVAAASQPPVSPEQVQQVARPLEELVRALQGAAKGVKAATTTATPPPSLPRGLPFSRAPGEEERQQALISRLQAVSPTAGRQPPLPRGLPLSPVSDEDNQQALIRRLQAVSPTAGRRDFPLPVGLRLGRGPGEEEMQQALIRRLQAVSPTAGRRDFPLLHGLQVSPGPDEEDRQQALLRRARASLSPTIAVPLSLPRGLPLSRGPGEEERLQALTRRLQAVKPTAGASPDVLNALGTTSRGIERLKVVTPALSLPAPLPKEQPPSLPRWLPFSPLSDEDNQRALIAKAQRSKNASMAVEDFVAPRGLPLSRGPGEEERLQALMRRLQAVSPIAGAKPDVLNALGTTSRDIERLKIVTPAMAFSTSAQVAAAAVPAPAVPRPTPQQPFVPPARPPALPPAQPPAAQPPAPRPQRSFSTLREQIQQEQSARVAREVASRTSKGELLSRDELAKLEQRSGLEATQAVRGRFVAAQATSLAGVLPNADEPSRQRRAQEDFDVTLGQENARAKAERERRKQFEQQERRNRTDAAARGEVFTPGLFVPALTEPTLVLGAQGNIQASTELAAKAREQRVTPRGDLAPGAGRDQTSVRLRTTDAEGNVVQDAFAEEARKRAEAKLKARGSDPLVTSDASKSRLEGREQARLESTFDRDFKRAQGRLLKAIDSQASSMEISRRVEEDLQAAKRGEIAVVKDAAGGVKGSEAAVLAAQARGTPVPGAAPQGLLERLQDRAGDAARRASELISDTRDRIASTKLGGAIGRGVSGFNDFLGRVPFGGTAALLAGPQLAEQITRFGGTAQEAAVGGEGRGERFVRAQGQGAAIQGALSGGFIGAALLGGTGFGPLGAAVGAATFAIIEWRRATKEAGEAIRDAKIGESLRTLGTRVEGLTALGTFRSDPTFTAEALSSLRDVRSLSREQAVSKESGLFTRFDAGTVAAQERRILRESLGGQLGGFTRLLANESERQARRLTRELPASERPRTDEQLRARAGQVFARVEEGGGGLNRELLASIANVRGVGVGEARAEQERFALSAVRTELRRRQNLEAEGGIDRQSTALVLLAGSAQAAAAGLKGLQAETAALADAFSGAVSAPRIDLRGDSLSRLGLGLDAGGALGTLGAAGGEAGRRLEESGRAFERLGAALPGILAAELANARDDTSLIARVTQGSRRSLGLGDQQGSAAAEDAVRAVTRGLNTLAGEEQGAGLLKISEAAGRDLSKLVQQLLQDGLDPLKKFGQETLRVLQERAQSLSDGFAQLARQSQQLRELGDRRGEAGLTAARARAELRGALTGERTAASRLGVEELSRPFESAVDRRLPSGLQGERDPQVIGSLLRRLNGEAQLRQRDLDDVAKRTGGTGEEFQRANEGLIRVKDTAAKAGEALQLLANVARANAGIEERLGQLRQEREGRLSLAANFATADPEAQSQLLRGLLLTRSVNDELRSGNANPLSGLSQPDRALFVNFLRANQGVQFSGLPGKPQATDLLNKSVEGLLGGSVLTPGQRGEESTLLGQRARNAGRGEEALGQLSQTMEGVQQTFLNKLGELQSQFIRDLRDSFKLQERTGLEQKRATASASLGTALDRQSSRSRLVAAGVTDETTFRAARDQREVIGKVEGLVAQRRGANVALANLSADDTFSLTDEEVKNFTTRRGAAEGRKNALISLRERAVQFLTSPEIGLDKGAAEASADRFASAVDDNRKKFLVNSPRSNADLRKLLLQNVGGELLGNRPGSFGQKTEEELKKALDRIANKPLREALLGGTKVTGDLDKFPTPQDFAGLADRLKTLQDEIGKLNQRIYQLLPDAERQKVRVTEAASTTSAFVGALGFAGGGFAPRGTDTVPAMLTPGEAVIPVSSVRANRAIIDRLIDAKGPVYLASGGLVGPGALARRELEELERAEQLAAQGGTDSPEEAARRRARMAELRSSPFALPAAPVPSNDPFAGVRPVPAPGANPFALPSTPVPSNNPFAGVQPVPAEPALGGLGLVPREGELPEPLQPKLERLTSVTSGGQPVFREKGEDTPTPGPRRPISGFVTSGGRGVFAPDAREPFAGKPRPVSQNVTANGNAVFAPEARGPGVRGVAERPDLAGAQRPDEGEGEVAPRGLPAFPNFAPPKGGGVRGVAERPDLSGSNPFALPPVPVPGNNPFAGLPDAQPLDRPPGLQFAGPPAPVPNNNPFALPPVPVPNNNPFAGLPAPGAVAAPATPNGDFFSFLSIPRPSELPGIARAAGVSAGPSNEDLLREEVATPGGRVALALARERARAAEGARQFSRLFPDRAAVGRAGNVAAFGASQQAARSSSLAAQIRAADDGGNNFFGNARPGQQAGSQLTAQALAERERRRRVAARADVSSSELRRGLVQSQFINLGGVRPLRFASGGLVPGHGLGDHVPALLEPGEGVLTRAAVTRNPQAVQHLNKGGIVRPHYMAEGGLVSGAPAQGAGVDPAVAGAMREMSSALGGFSGPAGELARALTSFAGPSQELARALSAFPTNVTLTARHEVNVNVNGGATGGGQTGALEELARKVAVAEVQKAFSRYLPDAGAVLD